MQLIINESIVLDSVNRLLEKHDFLNKAVYVAITLKNEQKTIEEIQSFFDNINSLTLINAEGVIFEYDDYNAFQNIQERNSHGNNFKVITLKQMN